MVPSLLAQDYVMMTCDVIQNAVNLIKLLWQQKQYSARYFLKEFPNRNWTLGGLNHLLRKIDNFGSVDRTVAGWYSSLIFSQLLVITLCVFIHDDRLIHKIKSRQWFGAADFCCLRLVLHYLDDILCKNYNYIFLFVQVMPKIIVVPFFSGRSVDP